MSNEELTPADRDALEDILDALERDTAVLGDASTPDRFGLPAIQDVPDARHLGHGLFKATHDGDAIYFDGGGAMLRPGTFSYTLVKGDMETLTALMDYDTDAVAASIRETLSEEDADE